MDSRNEAKKLIKLFIAAAYGISAIGDFIWIRSGSALSLAAFIPILAPSIAAAVVYYKSGKKVKVNLSKCSIKEALCCISIPIVYFVLSYIVYVIFTGNTGIPDLTIQNLFI